MVLEAMMYEHFMTTVYKCDRGGANGAADADYYRKMRHAVNLYEAQKKALDNGEVPVSTESLSVLKYDVNVAIRRIGNRVSEALREAIRNTYDDDKRNQLSALSAELIEVTDKEKLDEVIDKAWELVRPRDN